MDFTDYQNHVKNITIGKHLPEAIYIHQTALDHLTEPLRTLVLKVARALKISIDQWHLLKLYKREKIQGTLPWEHKSNSRLFSVYQGVRKGGFSATLHIGTRPLYAWAWLGAQNTSAASNELLRLSRPTSEAPLLRN